MDDGSAVILSVAKYYSPNGKAIQDTGVTPSVAVTEAQAIAESDDETTDIPDRPAPKPTEDVLLKKAIEVVTTGVKQTASLAAPQGIESRLRVPQGERK